MRLPFPFPLLLLAAPATAMQIEVPRHELCAASTQVVVAEVTSMETVWAADSNGGLETRVWLHTHREVRGSSPELIELVFPGGTKDGMTHFVEHSPKLVLDARYMLFLAPHDERKTQVLGGEQGVVRIASRPTDPGESLASVLSDLGDCRVR